MTKASKDNNTITMPFGFEPREYQLPLFIALDSGIRRAFLRWCRRSGKDLTCLNYMFKAMLEDPGNYYYIFPTYAQGRKAMLEGKEKKGRPYLSYMPPQLIKGNVNKNEMKFETINGSLFRIVGGDNYNTSIVGTGFRGCIISEFALQDKNMLDFLRPILRETGGWLIVNSTPRGKNHMYDLEQNVKGNPKWFFSEVQTLWEDLPNYYPVASQDDINEDRKEGMTEELIEQEYGVSYTAGQKGAYYADCIIAARDAGRIGEYPHNESLWVDTFWDLGKNDSTSIWFRQQKDDKLIWIDYYEDSNKDPSHYVEILQEKGYRFRTHFMPHDADHNTMAGNLKNIFANLMRSAGVSDDIVIADKPPFKRVAIDAVRGRFPRYYFNEATTTDGITKLSLYHRKWNDKLEVFMDMPVHDWTSHCADAMSTEALTKDVNEINMIGKSIEIVTDFDPLD